MTKVTYISADGIETSVDARDGDNLMEVALNNGVEGIDGDCGGQAACATCHVFVDPEWLSRTGAAANEHELALLDLAENRQENSRLSCQIIVGPELDGLRLHLPENQF